eukprot:850365-Alexandrium_andersonii.AAC.1
MSASLVGSEMCIRDSAHLAREDRLELRARVHRAEGSQAARPSRKEGVGPVSYTHLTLPTICSV